jgi:hypothetical protein
VADLDLDAIPDRGHRALAEVILQAVADQKLNTGDIESGFSITDMLLDFTGQLLTSVDDLTAQINALNIRADASEIRAQTAYAAIDDLQARVTALEQPTPPEA